SFNTELPIPPFPHRLLSPSYYVVVIPAIIHHPGHEKVCVHLSSLPETVHLAVTLEMKTQNHTLVEKDVEKPGIFECIGFKVSSVVSVHVVIHSGETVSYEGRKKVLVRGQKARIVIDTDKPFYKPGETVKFRIVTLDQDFKAIDKVVSIPLAFQEIGAISVLSVPSLSR
uniref:Uncharacterized protein n=1 Tax=Chelydra serpentina TaxID=8475 RepID=A0A8C3XWD4_CHESE